MIYQTMNDGHKIPIIGTGTNTYGKVDNDYNGEINDDTKELVSAIDAGYRLIDTAVSYRNERVIGKAVRESNLDRSEFFITTKFPMEPEFYKNEETIAALIDESLKLLDLDTIDLYLVHHPSDNDADNLRVYQGLLKARDAGKITSVGVSNFSGEQIEYLEKHTGVKPTVNQIRISPNMMNEALVQYCLDHDIIPQAWGPVSRVSDTVKDALGKIGAPYGKSWTQVLLKFHISRGVNVIPKSHNEARQNENIDLFDFELSDSDKVEVRRILNI